MTTGRGGPRRGAGRPKPARPVVWHVRRERFSRLTPAHVTLRVRREIPSLRCKSLVDALRASFARACEREDFRLVEYSIQNDHLHLIVEAEDEAALGRGMKSLSARVARAINRAFGRSGPVLAGRCHVRLLRSPTEVHHALAYVLLNARRHWQKRAGKRSQLQPARVDPASSGRWFEGWTSDIARRSPAEGPREVADARSWLLSTGWKKLGLIDPAATPGAH